MTGAADSKHIQPVAGNQKVAAGKPDTLKRPQEAGVHRRHDPAALADDVVVVTIDKAELGGPTHVDLLNESGRAQAGQGPIHGHEAQVGAPASGLLPNRLAGREVVACGERVQDRKPLRGHPPSGFPKKCGEMGVGPALC